MVSLLEQYETETEQANNFSDSTDLNNPFRSGYIQASLNLAENEEIFKSQRVQIGINERSIDQYEKCAGQMAILFKPKTIRLLHAENRTDEMIESPEAVQRFFLDKSGKHLLVATETNELYYYSRGTKKFRPISKLKGHLITAVGWNQNSSEKATDSILVGTKKGAIFELLINTNNEGILNLYIDSYCKQVYNFGKDTLITGIEIFHFKKENSSENIYDIVITTSTRLYEFIGSDSNSLYSSSSNNSPSSNQTSNINNTPIFASIFSQYETKSTSETANFYEMPGDIGYSQLQIRTNNKTKKKLLAWMTGGGILTHEFDLTSLAKFSNFNVSSDANKRLISESNQEIISYPQGKEDQLELNNPVGICLTEFHIAIFYKSQVKILCILNKEVVLNQKLDLKSIGGKTLGIWFDSYYSDFGSYTSKSIIKYIANKEHRKIWKIYLSKNEFESAKQYCRDQPANLNIVLTKQAEYLFSNKKFVESAIYFAQTQNSFEEICLKYLELNHFSALRTYLTHKLKTLDPEKEITQTTVVIAYIIEIFLNQLSDLSQDKLYDDYESLHDEFYKFLDNNLVKNCLKESKEAIYKIFSSHGNIADLIYFAQVMKDYPQIIQHYLQEENYRKALEALAKQNNSEIFYKYSPIFFELLPKELVDLWIKLANQLNPSKLIGSLASCSLSEEQGNEAIRYLEYCINRLDSQDQSLHNNLLTLYLQHKPEKLLEYVKSRKDDKIHFDILMIARLCTDHSNKYLNEACVYLYQMLGWYEEAVDLALNVNVDLARDVANSVNSDFNINGNQSDELKKMLWLRIARHVIEKENDVNKAMEFLHDLNETILIEDVLPYFPDFVTIDQFKEAIRSSLAAYTEKINTLKESIDQAAASAQLIRQDIQTIRQKSIVVNPTDTCSKCRFRLMTRRFYVFPCMHKFHSDCLYQACLFFLLPSKQKRIEELEKLLQDIQQVQIVSQPSNPTNSSLVNSVISGIKSSGNKPMQLNQTYSSEEIVRLKTELDDLLAEECPWCGERILKLIKEPFINELNYENVYNSWL